jgi:hypothetical protein
VLETLLIAFVVVFGLPPLLLMAAALLGFTAFTPVIAVAALARGVKAAVGWRPSRAQLQAVGKSVAYFAVAICPAPLGMLLSRLFA